MGIAQAPLIDSDNVSQSVVETVAKAEGVSPTELTPPLYEVVDPDALDQLFAAASVGSGPEVAFPYKGYEVTVDGNGVVSVESADA